MLFLKNLFPELVQEPNLTFATSGFEGRTGVLCQNLIMGSPVAHQTRQT
jgi:hypothetical protein